MEWERKRNQWWLRGSLGLAPSSAGSLGWWTSLVVQWLRFCAPNAGGPGLIPGHGTRPCMSQLKTLHAAKNISYIATKTWPRQINFFFFKKPGLVNLTLLFWWQRELFICVTLTFFPAAAPAPRCVRIWDQRPSVTFLHVNQRTWQNSCLPPSPASKTPLFCGQNSINVLFYLNTQGERERGRERLGEGEGE